MIEQASPETRAEGSGTGASGEEITRQLRFLQANLSAIPDFVYAFDRERRFA